MTTNNEKIYQPNGDLYTSNVNYNANGLMATATATPIDQGMFASSSAAAAGDDFMSKKTPDGKSDGGISDIPFYEGTVVVLPPGNDVPPGSSQTYYGAGGYPQNFAGGVYPPPPPPPPIRQGHSLCGCCCDMRRAVIIVNLIALVVVLVGAILFGVAASPRYESQFTDDATKKAFQDLHKGMAKFIVITVCYAIAYFLGIYGAIRFSIWMVFLASLAHTANAVVALLAFNWLGCAVEFFFAYPHFVFIGEVKKGIMTTEHYPIERQSCCCV